jgi:hypothetical protein
MTHATALLTNYPVNLDIVIVPHSLKQSAAAGQQKSPMPSTKITTLQAARLKQCKPGAIPTPT